MSFEWRGYPHLLPVQMGEKYGSARSAVTMQGGGEMVEIAGKPAQNPDSFFVKTHLTHNGKVLRFIIFK